MPFKPGQARPAESGRKKGTLNKPKISARERAEALGVDVIEYLIMYAKGDWKGLGYKEAFTVKYSPAGIEFTEETLTPQMRLKALSDVAQYIEPKLKSVEHSGAISSPDNAQAVKDLTQELIRITEGK